MDSPSYVVTVADISNAIRDVGQCSLELFVSELDSIVVSLSAGDLDIIGFDRSTRNDFERGVLSAKSADDLRTIYVRRVFTSLVLNYLFLSTKRRYWARDASFAYFRAADAASLLVLKDGESNYWHFRAMIARTRAASFNLVLGIYCVAFNSFVSAAIHCDELRKALGSGQLGDWDSETLEDECLYLLKEARHLERSRKGSGHVRFSYTRLLEEYELLSSHN